MTNCTAIINAIESGDPQAIDQLLPLVYEELYRLAAGKLARERPGQTLNATALVHEAYLRLIGPVTSGESPGANGLTFANRRHFFSAAAEAMRRILIERTRRRHSQKCGGHIVREAIDPDQLASVEPDHQLLALNEALDRLAEKDAQKAELVKLRYFAGLTADEAAETLGISPSTADRMWSYARAWLKRELTRS